MNTVFTQTAIDRMQAHDVDRTDVDRLFGLLDRAAETSGGLDSAPDVTLVRRNSDGALYLARAGSLRALLMTGASQDGVVVANVYLPDEEESGGSRSALREPTTSAQAG